MINVSFEEGEEKDKDDEELYREFEDRQHRKRYTSDYQEAEADRYNNASRHSASGRDFDDMQLWNICSTGLWGFSLSSSVSCLHASACLLFCVQVYGVCFLQGWPNCPPGHQGRVKNLPGL